MSVGVIKIINIFNKEKLLGMIYDNNKDHAILGYGMIISASDKTCKNYYGFTDKQLDLAKVDILDNCTIKFKYGGCLKKNGAYDLITNINNLLNKEDKVEIEPKSYKEVYIFEVSMYTTREDDMISFDGDGMPTWLEVIKKANGEYSYDFTNNGCH